MPSTLYHKNAPTNRNTKHLSGNSKQRRKLRRLVTQVVKELVQNINETRLRRNGEQITLSQ